MTRTLLLTTALDLFTQQGYAATTVDAIASAAGTTRVTFYAYFPSRSDLMKALIGELGEALQSAGSPAHGSPARGLAAVVAEGGRAALREWLWTVSGRWDVVRAHLNAAFEAAAVDPELRGLVDAWSEEAVGDIEHGLDQADRFEPSSRRLRGVLAMAQLDHVARTWTPGRWDNDREQVVDTLAESWAGLLGDASPGS
ncbi:TetR/AcrR family transcriptional regulator [Streptomyces mangrovisoli]|nr:TetR/AcrR family transcriptional regulator [Streptomyces mangrovisoli]